MVTGFVVSNVETMGSCFAHNLRVRDAVVTTARARTCYVPVFSVNVSSTTIIPTYGYLRLLQMATAEIGRSVSCVRRYRSPPTICYRDSYESDGTKCPPTVSFVKFPFGVSNNIVFFALVINYLANIRVNFVAIVYGNMAYNYAVVINLGY